MGDVMTDNLLDRLWNDRKLAFRDRRDLLTQDADPDLARDILADGLNRLEAMIVLALDLDWPPGQPTAKDLGRVLKVRTSPRLVKNSVQEDRVQAGAGYRNATRVAEEQGLGARRSSAPTASGTGSSWRWGTDAHWVAVATSGLLPPPRRWPSSSAFSSGGWLPSGW